MKRKRKEEINPNKKEKIKKIKNENGIEQEAMIVINENNKTLTEQKIMELIKVMSVKKSSNEAIYKLKFQDFSHYFKAINSQIQYGESILKIVPIKKSEKKVDMKSVFIHNIEENIKEEELEKLFKKYGKINKIEINKRTKNRGFCYIKLQNSEESQRIIESVYKFELNNNELKIQKLKENQTKEEILYSSEDSLFISNIQKDTTIEELKGLFKYFHVLNIYFPIKSKSVYGIVKFEDESSSANAIEKLNNSKYKDKIITCKYNNQIFS
jgi:RNA recognition motif-containing protein